MWMLLIPQIVNAKTHTETFVIDFSENDFVWSTNNEGEIEIDSNLDFAYPESDEPGLPIISKEIAIDGNYSYKSVIVSYEKRELLSDVRIAPSPIPTITDTPATMNSSIVRQSYDSYQTFPSSNCSYVSTSNWGNIKVLHFLTSPFVYEASTQKLYFIDSITLDVELNDHLPVFCKPLDRVNASILKSFVVNSGKVDELTASLSTEIQSMELEDRIDYVVITNQELASSFKPLCQWKTEKGVYAKVITIEDIKANYEGKDTQLKIKNYLHDLYEDHGLKYVLLGGDDTIVPVRGCYGFVKATTGEVIDYGIPTDMYYACFNGCFDWDDNGNGIYGELNDNIDLTQSIYISRLPIRSSNDVTAYIEKLLEYEKNPVFNNNILMCGVNMFNNDNPEQSDAEMKGNKLYEEFIHPYWKGLRYRFYDTATDFIGGNTYDLIPDNLKNQLEQGYSFMDIMAHGSQTSWSIENDKRYNTTYGNSQNNKAQTIITTIACFTNAFDSSTSYKTDPCLSESLIRNSNSGVVAYLGCSRQGWGTKGSQFGSSLKYESDFYKKLFSNYIESNNFAVLVAATKATKISSCYGNNSMRWIQFGLNPIGDPEMPIWISEPKKFKNVSVSINESFVNFNSGQDQNRICIVDEGDHGEGYFNVFEDTTSAYVSDLPEESSICFTKPGYIPKQYKLNILQNKSISDNRKFSNDVILCGSSITSSMKQGQFVIKEGKTNMTGDIVILGPGTKVESGAQLSINTK